jgi:hypothetical protein
MNINPEFKNLVTEKYHEMKIDNTYEDFLGEKLFGGIKVFINSKPKYCLITLHFENDDVVYVGSNEL